MNEKRLLEAIVSRAVHNGWETTENQMKCDHPYDLTFKDTRVQFKKLRWKVMRKWCGCCVYLPKSAGSEVSDMSFSPRMVRFLSWTKPGGRRGMGLLLKSATCNAFTCLIVSGMSDMSARHTKTVNGASVTPRAAGSPTTVTSSTEHERQNWRSESNTSFASFAVTIDTWLVGYHNNLFITLREPVVVVLVLLSYVASDLLDAAPML